MNIAPLVSAYRYRYHVLDAYPAQAKGLTRTAATAEDALRAEIPRLKAAADPVAAVKALIEATNAGTLAALRGVIAQAENDLVMAITRLGTDLGAPPTGPHIDLRAKLDGLDRSYKTTPPEGAAPDAWYDHFDAQIAHLAALAALSREVDQARAQPVKVPDTSPARLKWFLFAMIAAATVALGIAILTSIGAQQEQARTPETRGEAQPRTVRTVPIVIPVQPESTSPCRTFELDIGTAGATLMDAATGGRAVVQLEPNERVLLRQVVPSTTGRMVEIEIPARQARGFVPESAVRLPLVQWTCDR